MHITNSVFTRKNLNSLKNSRTTLGFIREMSNRQIPAPKLSRQGNPGSTGFQSRDSWTGPGHENHFWGWATWILTDESLEAKCGCIWEVKTPGATFVEDMLTLRWVLSPRAKTGFHNKYWRKIILCFLDQKKTGIILNMLEHSFLFNSIFFQEKGANQSSPWWVLSEPHYLGAGKHPVPVGASPPWGSSSQAAPWSSQFRGSGSLTDKTQSQGNRTLPSPAWPWHRYRTT